MSKVVEVKKDEESGEYYFDFEDLKSLFEDPSLIEEYSMEWRDDGSVVLEFFDKDGNKIFPKKA
jgi:hypothetical protein